MHKQPHPRASSPAQLTAGFVAMAGHHTAAQKAAIAYAQHLANDGNSIGTSVCAAFNLSKRMNHALQRKNTIKN